MDVPSALASINPIVDATSSRSAAGAYLATAAGAGGGRATPPAPGAAGGVAETFAHRDQQEGAAAPAGIGAAAAGQFAAFVSNAHDASVAAMYAPPQCNLSAPPAGMRANGAGGGISGGGGVPLRGSLPQHPTDDLPEATPAPLNDPSEALMLATYLRLVRETHGSEAAASAAASSAVTLAEGGSAGLGLLGLQAGTAAAALRSLSRPPSRPSSRPASAEAAGGHHSSGLMMHGGLRGPGELPYSADPLAAHDGGPPISGGGGDEVVSSMLGFIRDRKLATNNPPLRRPSLCGDSSASSSSSGGNRGGTMKIWIQPSGPRRPGEGTEDEEQGILTAEEVPASGDVMLRITLLAAGFVIGPAGASVREIMRRTGADIKSWTEATSGAKHRRPARIFLIGGDRRSMAQAIYVVTAAVDRYKELCEGKYSGQAVPRVQRVLGVEFAYQPPPKSTVPYAASLKGTHVGLPSQKQQAWPGLPARGGPRPPSVPPGRPPHGGRADGMPPLYPFGPQQQPYGSDPSAVAATYAAMLNSGGLPPLHPAAAMFAAADPSTAAALHAMAMAGGFGGALLPPMAAPEDAFGGFAIPNSGAAPLFPSFGAGVHDANTAAAAAAAAAAASFAASGAGGLGDYGGYGAQALPGAGGGAAAAQQGGGGYQPLAAGDALLNAAAAAAAASGLPVPIPGPPTELGAGRLRGAGPPAEAAAQPPRTPPTAGRPMSAASAEGGASTCSGRPSTPRAAGRAGSSHSGGGGNAPGFSQALPAPPAWAPPHGLPFPGGPPSPMRPIFAHPVSPSGAVPPMLAPLPLLGGIFPVMPGSLAFGPLPGMGAFSQVSVPPSPVRMLKSKAGVVPVVEVNGCTFFPTPPSPVAAGPPPPPAAAGAAVGVESGRGGVHPLQLLEDNPYLCQEAIGAPRSGFGGHRPPSRHHSGGRAGWSPPSGFSYGGGQPATFGDASSGAGGNDCSPPPEQQAAGDIGSLPAAGEGSPDQQARDNGAPDETPFPAAALADELQHGLALGGSEGAVAAHEAAGAAAADETAFDVDARGSGGDQDQHCAGNAAAAAIGALPSPHGGGMGAIPEEGPYPQQLPVGSPPRAGTPSGGDVTPRRAASGGDAVWRARLMSSDPMVSPGRLTLASKIKSARLTSSQRGAVNTGAAPARSSGAGSKGAAHQQLDFGAEAPAAAGAGGDGGGSPAAGNRA